MKCLFVFIPPCRCADIFKHVIMIISVIGLLVVVQRPVLTLVLCVCPAVGSVCCSYAGRHTNCREYCQAIFRTDSSPTVSQINAVKEYCQSISPQLIGCVANYTKSYPIRSPIDSKYNNCSQSCVAASQFAYYGGNQVKCASMQDNN